MSDADAPQAPPAATAAAAPAAATAAAEPESIGGTAAVSADVDHSVTSTASIGEAAAVAGQVLAPPPPPVESAPAPASPATAKRTPPAVAPKPPKGSVAATATPAAPAVAAAAAPVQVRNRLDQLFAEGPPPSVVASAATAPVIGESASSEPTAVASPAAVPKNRGGVGLVGLGTHTALKPSSVAHSSTSAAAEQSASTAAPPAPSNGLKTSLSLNSLPPPEAPIESEDPPAPSAQRMSGTMRVKSGWGRLKDLLAKGGDAADLLAKGGDAADGIADGGNAVMEPFPDGEWEADDLAVTAAEEPQAEEPVGPTKARARSNSIAAVDSLVQTASNATQYLNIKNLFKSTVGSNKTALEGSAHKKDDKRTIRVVNSTPQISVQLSVPASGAGDAAGPALPQAAAPFSKWYEAVGVDPSQLSEQEIKRQETIYELIQTEEDYINDLEMVQRVYIHEIQQHQLMTPKEVQSVFSNLEHLIGVNKELLKTLKERQKEGVVRRVGDVFVSLSSYFKMYTIYCGNQPDALGTLQKLKDNEELQSFLKSCQQKKESRNLPVTAFLLLPIQRICKYPLFLKTILKHTPDAHEDHEKMSAALTTIENVVDIVNERRRFVENQQKMVSIQAMLEFSDDFKLISPTRHYVFDATLHKMDNSGRVSERHGFLFNDILIWAKSALLSRKKFQVREIFHLQRCVLIDVADTPADEDGKNGKYCFEIMVVGHARYLMGFPDAHTKQQWFRPVKNITDKYLVEQMEARAQQAKAGPLALKTDEDDSDDEAEAQARVQARPRGQANPSPFRVMSIYSANSEIEGISLDTILPKNLVPSTRSSLQEDDLSTVSSVTRDSLASFSSQNDLHELSKRTSAGSDLGGDMSPPQPRAKTPEELAKLTNKPSVAPSKKMSHSSSVLDISSAADADDASLHAAAATVVAAAGSGSSKTGTLKKSKKTTRSAPTSPTSSSPPQVNEGLALAAAQLEKIHNDSKSDTKKTMGKKTKMTFSGLFGGGGGGGGSNADDDDKRSSTASTGSNSQISPLATAGLVSAPKDLLPSILQKSQETISKRASAGPAFPSTPAAPVAAESAAGEAVTASTATPVRSPPPIMPKPPKQQL